MAAALSREALTRPRRTRTRLAVPTAVRHRWAFTYGDQIEALYGRIARDAEPGRDDRSRRDAAELEHAVETEDAMTAEDFLLRRTKLHLTLDQGSRNAVATWFKPK